MQPGGSSLDPRPDLQATASAADLSVEFYVVYGFARVGDSAAFSSVLFSLFAWYLFVRGGFLWMSAALLPRLPGCLELLSLAELLLDAVILGA